MTPTTNPAAPRNHLDPWGFGEHADSRSAYVEFFEGFPSPDEPVDEPVDPADLQALAVPVVTAAATAHAATLAPPARTPRPAAAMAVGLRLPQPREMFAVLGLFGAIIIAQAFYIGFSLTGEASARIVAAPATTTPAPRAEAPVASAPLVPAGSLQVDTGTAPAQVQIDGVPAGTTPLSRTGLAVGAHEVRVLFAAGAVVERRVDVQAGQAVSLVLDPPAPRAAAPSGPVGGWVHVAAPFEVEVFAAGHLIGTSANERILLPAGTHTLSLVNGDLGYRAVVPATIVAGRVATLTVETPRVAVAVNAQPWAEVVVDGRSHGETPLAHLMLPIGVHQVVLRHPDLGERAETVTVRATGANRVAADLRR